MARARRGLFARLIGSQGGLVRATALVGAVVLVMGVVVDPGVAQAATPAVVVVPAGAAPVVVSVKPDEFSAMLAARAQGSRVEVLSARSQSTKTYANPDGSLTTESFFAPMWITQPDGSWRDVDTTLVAGADGSVSPRVGQPGVVFSGAVSGTGWHSFAGLGSGTGAVSWLWRGALPTPSLAGDTATYTNVLPGVNLLARATASGFETSVVFTARPRGPVVIPMAVRSGSSVSTVAKADGSLSWGLPGGLRADSPAASMWDARVDATGVPLVQALVPGQLAAGGATSSSLLLPASDVPFAAPGSGVAQSPVAGVGLPGSGTDVASVLGSVPVGARGWVLAPSASYLSDPATVYPVTVDPTVNLSDVFDTWVQSNLATSQATLNNLRIGNANTLAAPIPSRTFVQFNTRPIAGAQVTAAWLHLFEFMTPTCTPRQWTVKLTGGVNASTVWSNQPAPTPGVAAVTSNATLGMAGCAGGWVAANVTSLLQYSATNSVAVSTLGITGSDETDPNARKYFYAAEYGAAYAPYVSVTYDHVPAIPSLLSLTPETGPDTQHLLADSLTPTLGATLSDADGGAIQGQFQVLDSTGSTCVYCASSTWVTSGGKASVTVPPGYLVNGGTYTIRVKANDGTLAGAWTATDKFTVDVTPPGAPTLSASGFANGVWAATAPGSNVFSFAQPTGTTDTTVFQYRQDNGPWSNQTATAGAGSVAWLPTSGGHTFAVRAVDAAGNGSAWSTFGFGVGVPAVSTVPQTQVAGYAPISGTGPSGATGAYVQYSPHSAGTWTRVPDGDLLFNGAAWTGTGITNSGATATLPALAVDLTAAGAPAAPVSLDLELCLTYPSLPDQCTSTTSPLTVQRVPHDTASTTRVGPGSVSLGTGELTYSATDSTVPGYSGSLGVSRTLLSLDAAAGIHGPFGPGWAATVPTPDAGYLDSTITDHVTATAGNDGTMQVGYPDGSADTFTVPGWTGSLPTGAVTLAYTGENDTDTSGVTLSLSVDRRTVTITDTDGTTTTFTRSVVPGTFSPGQVTEPATVVGGQGITSTVVTNAGSLPPGAVSGDTWTSTVQAAPGITCTTWVTGCRVLTVVTAGPGTATPTDSSPGPFPGQVREETYTAYNPARTGSAGLDTVTTAVFAYDHLGRLVQAYDPRADVTAGTHLITGYGYDGSNRIVSITPPGLNAWTLGYDTAGRLVTASRTDPANGTATTTVAYGVPLSGTGLPSMTATDVAAWGQPSSSAPSTAVAVFNPDHTPAATPTGTDWPFASLTYLDATGVTVNTAAYGVASGTPGWQITTTVHDTAGREIWSLSAGNRAIASSGAACTDPVPALVCALPATSRAALLATQTLYSTTDPTEVTDTYGPAVTVTLPDGTTGTSRAHTHTTYDQGAPATLTTTLGVSALRLPTTVISTGYIVDALTDPTALTGGVESDVRTTTNGYDPVDGASSTGPTSGWVIGQPTSVSTTATLPGTTTVQTITSRTVFDAAGRVVQNRQPGSTGSDQGTRVSVYYTTASNATVPLCGAHPEWDGLLCQTSQAGTGAALPVQTVTGYSMLLASSTIKDVSGSLTRQTDTTFDAAGRTVSTHVWEPAGAIDTATVPIQTYAYYPSTGLPSTVSSSAGTAATLYDALGRTTSQSDGTAATAATTAYDIDSRPVTVSDAKGTTTYRYDENGEHRGLLTSMDAGLGGGVPSAFTNLNYDAAGTLTSFVFPNGVVEADSVDPAGQLTNRSYTDTVGNPVASWTRTYTVHGQVATETGPGSTGSRITGYSYDESGRLTQASDLLGAACTVRRYTFNVDSARTGMSSWAGAGDGSCPVTTGTASSVRAGVVNSYDQLTSTTVTGTGAGTGAYFYDALGRVTSLPGIDAPGPNTGTPVALGYFANDLAAKQTQGATVRAYALDALGRLGSWVDTAAAGNTTTVNHYDGGGDSPAWTDTGTGTWTRQVGSPAGGLGLIATGTTGTGTATSATVQIVSPHGDVFASVPDTTAVTAASVSGASDTDEYGNVLAGTAKVYGWVGGKNRIIDTTTGLVQMGVRLYNPVTAAFESVDPVYGGNATAYGYPVDPIVDYDISGECPWCVGALAFGVAMDWNPIGWVVTAAVAVVGTAYVGYEGYQAWERTRDSGVSQMGKRPARNGDRDGHRGTKNGKKGNEKHTKAEGHGGGVKPNFKPNPQAPRRGGDR